MDDHDSTEALRLELNALFDRVLEHGKRVGIESALTSFMVTAREQIKANANPHSSAISAPATSSGAKISEAGRRALNRKRAPSGSIMRTVQEVLGKSLVPLRVHAILEAAESVDGIKLKDTSVRMALNNMRDKSLVVQNDIGEWSLARRETQIDDLQQLNSDINRAFNRAA